MREAKILVNRGKKIGVQLFSDKPWRTTSMFLPILIPIFYSLVAIEFSMFVASEFSKIGRSYYE